MMKIASFRGYLLLLQVIFLTLYGALLQPSELGIAGGVSFLLAILTILAFIVPLPWLGAPWVHSMLTLGNGWILLATVPHAPGTEPGMVGAVTLLLAMASYLSSILHFVIVSSLLVGGYGLSLYQADLLQTSTVLLLPAFLSITLVFLSKMGVFQAEIQRLADDKSRQPSAKDPLT